MRALYAFVDGFGQAEIVGGDQHALHGGSSSFLGKKNQKTLDNKPLSSLRAKRGNPAMTAVKLDCFGMEPRNDKATKVFCFFFSKKKPLP
jgi:hypothetical protein